jgi:hypothetical protein
VSVRFAACALFQPRIECLRLVRVMVTTLGFNTSINANTYTLLSSGLTRVSTFCSSAASLLGSLWCSTAPLVRDVQSLTNHTETPTDLAPAHICITSFPQSRPPYPPPPPPTHKLPTIPAPQPAIPTTNPQLYSHEHPGGDSPGFRRLQERHAAEEGRRCVGGG